MRSSLYALIAAALLACPVRGAAQDSTGSSDAVVADQAAEVAQRARREFEQGYLHFEARRFREAIHAFQVAAELVPSADLWFNIARAHEELGEWEQAIEHYHRYLRDRVDPPDAAQVEARIALLEERAEAARAARLSAPTTGSLSIRVDLEGAEIHLDDNLVGTSPLPDDLTLEPGRHMLVVQREGHLPSRSEVGIEPGLRTAAYVTLQPETRYRSVQGDRIFTWISFGLSGAALGTSIGLGIESASRQGRNLESAREWATYSDGALGACIGLAALGVVLWFIEGRAIGTERVSPSSTDHE